MTLACVLGYTRGTENRALFFLLITPHSVCIKFG